jgi:hypothetical protein
MQTLAPLVDQIREIAQDKLPSRRTLKLQAFDDGDYDLVVFHSPGPGEREQILYERDTGIVRWQYLKNPSMNKEFISEEAGTLLTTTFEERKERRITTIDPPTEPTG